MKGEKNKGLSFFFRSSVILLLPLYTGSFTVLGKKECLYISVVAESTLICLLLDVLDGRWLYSILLSAGESLILTIVLRNYSTKPSYIFQLKRELKVWKYIFSLFHFEMLIKNTAKKTV
jgi:hypothetical protein